MVFEDVVYHVSPNRAYSKRYDMEKVLDNYFAYPLDSFESNFDQRFLLYLVYGFLVGTTTFISLNILGWLRGYPVIQAFQGMYSWHTTLNFTLCLVLVTKVFRLFRSRNPMQKGMTVTHLWLIGLLSFVMAFYLQRTVVYSGVQNYNPKLIQYYNQYPDARPAISIMFVWCFSFWMPVYLACSSLVIWQQKKFMHYAETRNQLNTGRWALDGGKFMISTQAISHISMEDHYARIWWRQDDEMHDKMVRLTMRDAIKQLPEDQFVQIHRSHLINSLRAEGLVRKSQKWFVNIGGTELPVSRTRLADVKTKLHG